MLQGALPFSRSLRNNRQMRISHLLQQIPAPGFVVCTKGVIRFSRSTVAAYVNSP